MGDAALAQKTCPTCNGTFDAEAVFCPKDGTKLLPEGEELAPDSDPYIGTVIGGDIELRAVAGAGAMGRVYRAHQRGIDRDVAVKILHRELSGNPQLVQRFHREAKIASKLQHPHVVEVYLAGQLPDRALYIVMEYLDGMSLAATLAASGGHLGIERALTIALQICDAVGEGHARGIVHRDLKPENVMLVRRAEIGDWVKVLDFGIAKVNIGEQSMETAAGLIFGTARYISPEGAQGTTVGPPGDVYSLAVIVYQMLAGRTPFDAEQPVGLLIKHIHETPPPLHSFAPARDVPEPVARVVMDNLAKDPARRASSARAFASALAAAAKEANVSFSDVGVIARMSSVDMSPVRMSMIEPTLDDAAAVPAILAQRSVAPVPSAAQAPNPATDRTEPSNPPALLAPPVGTFEPAVKPPAADPEPRDRKDVAPPSRRGRSSTLVVILAFLLGAALAVIGTQQLQRQRDEQHDALVEKTRRALTEGRYTSPPGDNVRELAAMGAKKWPDDSRFEAFRSTAAHELSTRALALRSAGDLIQARDLVKQANDLDPSDRTARMLLEQYEDELLAMSVDAGSIAGAKVLLDVNATRARPGGAVELVARILVGGAPRPAIASATFVVTGPGLPKEGRTISPASESPFKATFIPPRAGTYDATFEANAEGHVVRATRSFDVNR
ncbi:MAG: protein kinase [Deltaproteobacteria bacterium]|nr:protein kinase [Deltaproteobacteria bacterium]